MRTTSRPLLAQWQFWVKVVISLGIAVAFGWWVQSQGIDLVPSAAQLRLVLTSPWGVGVFVLSLLLVHFLRAYRWVYLLRPLARDPIPVGAVLAVAFVGFLAIMLLPLRSGEFARPYLISTRGHVGMSAAFGTIAIERVIDGLVLSAALTVCLLVTPLQPDAPSWTRLVGVLTLGIFVAAAGVLVLLLWQGEPALVRLERLGNAVLPGLSRKVAGVLREFVGGLAALPSRGHLMPFVAMTVVYWAINGLGMWALAQGFGLSISLTGAFTVMSLLAVGILLPTGPGHFGNFQASVAAALAIQPLPPGQLESAGAAYIFTMYLIMLGITIVTGLGSMLTRHISLTPTVGAERRDSDRPDRH